VLHCVRVPASNNPWSRLRQRHARNGNDWHDQTTPKVPCEYLGMARDGGPQRPCKYQLDPIAHRRRYRKLAEPSHPTPRTHSRNRKRSKLPVPCPQRYMTTSCSNVSRAPPSTPPIPPSSVTERKEKKKKREHENGDMHALVGMFCISYLNRISDYRGVRGTP
jgi:hypothetical protein